MAVGVRQRKNELDALLPRLYVRACTIGLEDFCCKPTHAVGNVNTRISGLAKLAVGVLVSSPVSFDGIEII